MTSVSISPAAAALIRMRSSNLTIATRNGDDVVPQLTWVSRTTVTDLKGVKTDLGPGFYFFWVTSQEARLDDRVIVDIPDFGEFALAPGGFFREGTHAIDAAGGELTLDGRVQASFPKLT